MRGGFGELVAKRYGNWLLPGLFAALATAVFVRPYAIQALRHGIGGTLHKLAASQVYSRTVIASNYFDDGFVRRGLGGTLAVLLSDDWNRSIWLFIALSFLLFIVPLALIVRRLSTQIGMGRTIYMGVILAASPQSFWGWSRDPGRTDLLVGACLAFSMLAWLRGQRAVALAVILVGLLIHETSVVYGLPLLAAMAIIDLRSGSLDRREAFRLAFAAAIGVARRGVGGCDTFTD